MNLIWLRNDLRLEDNPALFYGATDSPCFCLYIISQQQWAEHYDAPAKQHLWRQRLIELSKELAAKNIPLKLLSVSHYQKIAAAIKKLAKEHQVNKLFFNVEYPLNEKNRDQQVIQACEQQGIDVSTFHGDVVMPPGSVMTQQNAIYRVFTPFSRQWHKQVTPAQLDTIPAPKKQAQLNISSDDIASIWKTPKQSFRDDIWPVSTAQIHKQLDQFCQHKVAAYKEQRDFPSIKGTSLLSPYLVMGAISPRQCISAVRTHQASWQDNQWVTEIIWREFYRHLTDHYPHLSRGENFIQTAKPIPWQNDDAHFQAWCDGQTGFPIVDAAMRQLNQTGWMHNRLRMITAAFLTKLLLIDWRKGEQYFMEKLIDGDYASNNGGWQWAASTGADAAPYFRIFNPERQSQRFDKEGGFIKKLVPELSDLNSKSIHTPSTEQRQACGYPEPIVDYKFARQRALDRYAEAMGKQ